MVGGRQLVGGGKQQAPLYTPPTPHHPPNTNNRRLIVGFEEEWKSFLLSLSKSDLQRLNAIWKEVVRQKYPKWFKSEKKCRNAFLVFTDQELLKFFSVIPAKRVKFAVLFFTQLLTGFRIGEVCQIKLSDIDFEHQTISVFTEKARVQSEQPAPAILLDVINEWISTNHKQITAHQNYLFFTEYPYATKPYVDPASARNMFNKFRELAGLNRAYAEANDLANRKVKRNRPLYTLNTHSLRRTYLTRLYIKCKDKELVRVLARHKKKEVTDYYIYFPHTEQLELVNEVFNKEPFTSIANSIMEKIRYYSAV